MTDHHEQDIAMPSDATTVHPRPRRPDRGADRTAGTRLDPHGLYDVAEPTVATPFDPRVDRVTMRVQQRVNVSPIGAHTRGAVAETPAPAARINFLLDERDRAQDRRDGRAAAQAARTVREEAHRRAAAKLRHEQHLERLETVRAWALTLITLGLLVIVVGAAVVGWGILSGWFGWGLVRTP